MSRTRAKAELSLEIELKIMSDAGVLVHGLRHRKNLEDAPSAYKSIENVLDSQEDLVKRKIKLMPLGVIMGGE